MEAMARRAIEILSDEKKRASMSEASRQLAVSEYEATQIVPLYENFYARVLEEPPAILPAHLAPPEGLA